MTRKYRCPICIDNAMLVYPKTDPNFDTRYDHVSLVNHVYTHTDKELVTYVVESGENPDEYD